MFSGFGKSNAEHQRSVLALLNDDRLTPAQKSAYCFDQGICEGCGVKIVWVGPLKRRPLTNEKVLSGVCRGCHPAKCNEMVQTAPVAPWEQMQKLVVPPDVLLAKTSGAFSSLQSSVSKGINHLNNNTDVTEKSRALSDGTSKAFSSLQTSVTEGINTLNDNIKKSTENMDADKALNSLQTSVSKGINDIKTRREQKKQSDAEKMTLSGLKNSFKNGGNEFGLLEDIASTNRQSNQDLAPENLKGKSVSTPFGRGVVRDFRQQDGIFVVDLHSGIPGQGNSKSNTKLFCKRESFEVEHANKNRQKESMELNEAYESLEKMRRLNLELECQERGIVGPIDFMKCKKCLLYPDQEKSQQQPQTFRRIRKLMNDHRTAIACLFCAAPTCADHSCPAFRKEGITACLECVKLFEPDYLVHCLNEAHGLSGEMAIKGSEGQSSATEERPLEMMMDLYDRVILLLRYSSQYIESIAVALEENTKKYNNLNVRASSVGIVSGALGVAAAAAIFTPAGPPLLIASLTLGGGATAAQSGTEAVNYFSEPNKFADKILALIGMVHSLLKVKESLREILTARLLAQQGNPDIDRLKGSLVKLRTKQKEAMTKAGMQITSTAVLGSVAVAEVAAGAAAVESAALISTVEVGTLAGRNANMLSKSGTAIARGARFARFAGGALSAATILLEARTLSKTIEQIKKGHPCEKATALRSVLEEIPGLPTTDQLDEECRIYIGAMTNRVNSTSLEDAISLIEAKAIQEWQMTKAQINDSETPKDNAEEMAPGGVSILDGDDIDDDDFEWESVTGVLSASLQGGGVPSGGTYSTATPAAPVPATVSSVSLETIDGANATNEAPQTRLSQSMPQLPSEAMDPEKQSALLDRIKKFKEEDQ